MTTNRRFFLAATATALAGLATSGAAGAGRPGPGRTFVLVHGTWHGGWVWRDVRRLLRDRGHRVFTPTCTGCGERIHLTGPEVGLETHIQDVARVIEFEELDDVVLVGHSFAGMTITGVADRLRERIRRIVFFDALVPRAGRMAAVPRDPGTGDYPDWWKARREKFIDGYQMVLWEDYPVEMLVPAEETEIVARLERLITTHPARQWTDELVLERGGWAGLDPAYIHCVGQRYRKSSDDMIGPARGPGWDFVELDIPRDGMLTHPETVAATLVRLAG